MPAVGSRETTGAPRVKPRSDAYVGLLGLSLLALCTAMLFAFLSWDSIKEQPKKVQMAPAGGGVARPGPAGPAPNVNPPVAPQPDGNPPAAPAPGPQPGVNPPQKQ